MGHRRFVIAHVLGRLWVHAAGFAEGARAQSVMALERARGRLEHAADLARLERAARLLLGAEAAGPQSPSQERRLAEVLP